LREFRRLVLVEWKAKAATTAAILAYWTVGYVSLNHLEVDERVAIPLTFLDDAPFLPWTILVYHSIYVLCGLGIWLHPSRWEERRHLLAVAIAYSINFLFFAIFPTVLERPPLPESDSMWLWLVDLTWKLDAPHTCFPSLHVSNGFVVVCAYWGTRCRYPFLIWTLLICASTLTVRQHFFWDLPSGALIGVIGFLGARRIVRRPTQSPEAEG
jgi:membrane-associated phospholipid phosphatase